MRTRQPDDAQPLDLIVLCNNIYYFAPDERVELYRSLRARLGPRRELVVVTMTRPGSTASAHLHFMLCCRDTQAALPTPDEFDRDLRAAGFTTVEITGLVPTEPFVGVLAR